MKVLVTGAGALLGQGIIRALRASALDAHIVAVDPNPLSAGLYWADARHIVPLARAPDYLDRLRELLARERPEAVLVGTDVELPILARHRHELEREFATRVLVSDPRVVAIADDKHATYRFLRAGGFDYPATALPDEAEALARGVGFPLIVKPRVGARSVGVMRVHDRDGLQRALAAATAAGDEPIVQEDVGTDRDEYTASALVFEGACRASVVMRRDLRDGNTYRAFAGPFPELNRLVHRLGEALAPFGPANFQFRLDRAGQAKVFEINARFSGTTPLRALAGLNEVEMCLRYLLLGEAIGQPAVEEMIILRHWAETVVRPGELAKPG
jgi:carbamoyl-phosphate synthase large subunit